MSIRDDAGCERAAATSLTRLLQELDRFDSAVPLALLESLLREWRPQPGELLPYLHFDERGYCRNRIRLGDAYEALLLCWRPGQLSPIHDHAASSCAFRVLRGLATETRFERCGRWVRPVATQRHTAGAVCGSTDDGIHELGNLHEDPLVTLHLYSPVLVSPRTYERVRAAAGVTVE